MSEPPALYPDGYHALTRAGTGSVVFALHGQGGTSRDMFDIAHSFLPAATIIAPQGDVCENGTSRFFRRRGEGLFDMTDLAARTEKMARFIAQHSNGDPVFAFGYSNGANILASVMMRHPTLIQRAGLLHPLIPWAPEPQPLLAGARLVVTGGKRDPLCPLSLTTRLADWFQRQGATVETLLHPGSHELVDAELSALKALLTRV